MNHWTHLSQSIIALKIRYNIIHNSSGDEGIQLRNVEDAVIEYNHVYATAGDGINLCCGSTGGIIRFNEVHDISSQDAAIYTYDASNTTIEGNLIYDVYTNGNNDGLRVGNKNGKDAKRGASVKGNVVHAVAADGIAVYISDVLVESNEVYDCYAENGAIYLRFAITNITVCSNSVHDNVLNTTERLTAPAIFIESAVDAANVTINYNSIYNNTPYGLTSNATVQVNATNNWWGANDGPNASPGSGDKISGNVTYDPWLVLGVSANPGSILVGGNTSVITADMTKNRAGQNTSAQGHIPDGTQIIFTTNKGSVGSTTVNRTTTNGTAAATLTSSDTVGTATVCARAPGNPAHSEECTTVDFVWPKIVGGQVYPINKIAVLAPWLALAAAIIAGSVVALRRRRAQG